jgi:hypothetical protein
MKYHDQLIAHDPENGRYGDCFRTVLACQLDMHPAEFPHPFENGFVSDKAGIDFVNDYLATKGLVFVEIPFIGTLTLKEVLIHGKAYSRGNRYTLLGTSTTGTAHVVSCLEDKIEHNPNGATLVGPADCGADGQFWWIGWLVHKC